MRAVMGILPPRAGAIRFDDARPHRAPGPSARAAGIGYMPEDRKLVPDFTVGDNILLPLWATGTAAAPDGSAWIYALMPELRRSPTAAPAS